MNEMIVIDFLGVAYCCLIIFLLCVRSRSAIDHAITQAAELDDFTILLLNLTKSFQEFTEAVGEVLVPVTKQLADGLTDIQKALGQVSIRQG